MGVQRLIVTLTMWVAYMVVLGIFFAAAAAPTSSISGDIIFGVVLAVSAAVGISTVGIWRAPAALGDGESAQRAQHPAKSKRQQASRLQELIQRLDEDEIVELETLLESREELPHDRLR